MMAAIQGGLQPLKVLRRRALEKARGNREVFHRCSVAFVTLSLLAFASAGSADLLLDDDGAAVTIRERDRPVLTFQYGPSARPGSESGEPAGPSLYLHPIFGLNSETLTGAGSQRSGVHWIWRNCRASGRLMDIGAGDTAERVFERWLGQSVTEQSARLEAQNVWIFTDSGRAQILETVRVTVYPETRNNRVIDVSVHLRNVSNAPVEIFGGAAGGGFCARVNPELKGLTLSGGSGLLDPGAETVLSPWVDVSYRDARRSSYSGFAIFQDPANPGYSRPNWSMAEEGLVCAGLHADEHFPLQTGEFLEFRYRILLHRGYGPNVRLETAYAEYLVDIQRDGRE